jgi:hypothetical protein
VIVIVIGTSTWRSSPRCAVTTISEETLAWSPLVFAWAKAGVASAARPIRPKMDVAVQTVWVRMASPFGYVVRLYNRGARYPRPSNIV